MKSKECKVGPFVFKWDWMILSVLLIFGVLFYLKSTSYYLPLWDEGDLMRAANQALEDSWIYLGSGFKPLYTTVLAGTMLILGGKTWVGIGLVTTFGLLALYFTYLVVEKLSGSRFIGAMSALIFGLTKYFFYYVRVPRTETMAAFYFLFIMWFYLHTREKEYYWRIILAVLIGIGMWVRTTLLLIAGIIIAYEFILLLKKEIPRKKFWKKGITLAIIVIIMYLATFSLYSTLEPKDAIEAEGGYQAEDYNNKTGNEIFELLKNPFADFNPVFYSNVVWQMTGPLFALLLLGALMHFLPSLWEKKKTSLIYIGFLFLFFFFSFFPHHRYKVFFVAIPFASALIVMASTELFTKKVNAILLTILCIGTLLVSMPLYSYHASGPYEAMGKTMEYEPQGILTSNQGIYLYYGMYDNPGKYYLERDRIKPAQKIETLEELEELHEQGYTHLIFDYKGYNLVFREAIRATTPLETVENDVWKQDPIIEGNYAQIPYFTPKDYIYREDWISHRQRDDPLYEVIGIYSVEDIIQTWRQQ